MAEERAAILRRRARFVARALASAGLGAALSQACAARKESEPAACLSTPVPLADAGAPEPAEVAPDAALVEAVVHDPQAAADGGVETEEAEDEEGEAVEKPGPRACLDFVF